jgi:hypothetical protein
LRSRLLLRCHDRRRQIELRASGAQAGKHLLSCERACEPQVARLAQLIESERAGVTVHLHSRPYRPATGDSVHCSRYLLSVALPGEWPWWLCELAHLTAVSN